MFDDSITAEQRSLAMPNHVTAYVSEEIRERIIRDVERRYPQGDTRSYRQEKERLPVATDPKYAGWQSSPRWEDSSTYPPDCRLLVNGEQVAVFTDLQEPHTCGKGFAYQVGERQYACTGCDTTLTL